MDENLEVVPPMDRRTLLPIWIKIFIWIFMIIGAMLPIGIVLALLGAEFQLALYGWKTQKPFSVTGLMLMILFLYKGITAFALWSRKDVAILLGEIDAIIGIALCMFMMVFFQFLDDEPGFQFTFRGEILLLIPYFLKLERIKQDWKEARSRAAGDISSSANEYEDL